jgi:hypothetical protein
MLPSAIGGTETTNEDIKYEVSTPRNYRQFDTLLIWYQNGTNVLVLQGNEDGRFLPFSGNVLQDFSGPKISSIIFEQTKMQPVRFLVKMELTVLYYHRVIRMVSVLLLFAL